MIFNYAEVKGITKEMFADGLCLFLVTRDESESHNTSRINSFMETLRQIGSPACQNVIFGFNGYDSDAREIYVIDGARNILKSLAHEYPYFGYFINPADQSLFACLLPLEDIKNGTIKIEDATRTLRWIKDGIRAYGQEVGDNEGARKAISRWQTICMP